MKTNHDIKRGVSLYSYQDHFYFGKYNLEDCIATAAGCGAEGFEIMPEMMIPSWPHVSDDFVSMWNGWMEKYDVTPAVLTHFADRAMHKNKLLTDDELYERSILYIKMAHKLGCRWIRLMHSYHGGKDKLSPYDLVNPKIAERLIPVAEYYDVKMAMECHSPSGIDDPVQQEFVEVAEKHNTKYLALQLDMSSCEKRPSIAVFNYMNRQGVPKKTTDFLASVCDQINAGEKINWDTVEKTCHSYGPFDENEEIARPFKLSIKEHRPPTPPEVVKEYASKLTYIHAKFHWADEDGTIENIDYPAYIKALQEGGYKGYLNSEFEGNRFLNDMGEVDEVEFVRRQHVLFQRCLGY